MSNEKEVLYLSIEIMREGSLFKKEFSFMCNSEVYSRTSVMYEHQEEDGFRTKGWFRLNGPDGAPIVINLDSLPLLAEKAKAKNWEVVWNPEFDPNTNEFVKKVEF